MRSTFVTALIEQAEKDDRIFVVSPDMGFSVFERYIETFPDRFINVGIAEQNAIGVAAGLALSGKIVYVYSIIPFVTMRCFEQVRLDVAYMNLNVRLVGVGAGLTYGPAGATHQAIEDIAIMRALPNMTVCAPGDPVEVRELFKQSFTHQGPMYFRMAKNRDPIVHADSDEIVLGKASILTEGNDLALITTSNLLHRAKEWTDKWAAEGKRIRLISMHTVKPLDTELINGLIDEGIPMVTLEEHNLIGGLGSAVAEIVAESGKAVYFKRMGLPDSFCHLIGKQDYLREKFGLDRICFDF